MFLFAFAEWSFISKSTCNVGDWLFLLFESLHRAAVWCRSRCRAWTSTGHHTNEAVVLSHRFTLDGSAVHHQPFSTHADTPWNDLKSPVNLMCMFLDSGKNQEYPEKRAHRNAEVTTKRRSFLPCRDSADHHRAAMPLHLWCLRSDGGLMWCQNRESYKPLVYMDHRSAYTKGWGFKGPPLSLMMSTLQISSCLLKIYSTTTFSPFTSHYCRHFCPLNKLLDVAYFNSM